MAANRAVDGSRGLILVPSLGNPTDTFEIIAATASTITVKGNMTSAPNNQTFGVIYGQSIKSFVMPNGGIVANDLRAVKFFEPDVITGTYGGYVDLTASLTKPVGLCQVCHDATTRWGNNNSGNGHYPTTDCASCHNIISTPTGQTSQTITNFNPPTNKTYGDGQITLSATGGGSTSPVTFSVVSGPGNVSGTNNATLTITGAGIIVVKASQSGTSTFAAAADVSASITVNKATPLITWANPADITYGTALSATQLNASAGAVGGTFVYTPPSGTILTVGAAQTLSVTFTPTTTANYNNVTVTATINVTRATPVITWANPADITYGTALTATQLNATSGGVAGTFVYTPASGTVLSAGAAQTLSVTFTPTTTANYNNVTATATINVNKATPFITWANPADITYGTALSATQLNASAGGVAGSFVYTPASGAVLNGGTAQTLSVNFTPSNTTNYNSVTATATINVSKATPVIAWANPNDITVGTALTATQLNATSGGVAGTFVYTPASGTVLSAGANQTLSVTFTPSNTTNYNSVTATAIINVNNKINPVIVWANPADITYGTALSATQLNASAGAVAGSFVYTPASGAVLNGGTAQTLSVTFTPSDTASYNSVTATATINVNKANPVIAWANPAAITYGAALSATQLNASAGAVAGTFVYTPASGAVLTAGANQTLSVTFTPTSTANYNSVTATVTITVTSGGGSGNSVEVSVTSLEVPISSAGNTATFTVTLKGTVPPTGANTVVINLSSDNTSVGTVSPASLTFTALDTPQTVTVTGIDDTLDDANKTFNVILSNTISGDGAYSNLPTPDVAVTTVDIIDVYSVTPAISSGNGHNLLLANDGTVWGWGRCAAGQLGLGASGCSSLYTVLPTQLPIDKAAAVSAGYSYSMIVTKDQTVWSSGLDTYGSLGHATSDTFQVIAGIDHVKTIAAGNSHTLALKYDGTVWAWGQNGVGQLGDATTEDKSYPVQAFGLSGITSIAIGKLHSMALNATSGFAYSWGSDGYKQLGSGILWPSDNSTSTPTAINSLSLVTTIGVGQNQSFAYGTKGGVKDAWGWGSNVDNLLGVNTLNAVPDPLLDALGNPVYDTQVPPKPITSANYFPGGLFSSPTAINIFNTGTITPSKIVGGYQHTVAIRASNGQVYAWGDNDKSGTGENYDNSGALGNGTTVDVVQPTMVFTAAQKGTPTAVAMDISAGSNYTLVLFTDGQLMASGLNDGRQLGTNENLSNSTFSVSPVFVEDPGDVGLGFASNLYAYRPVLAGYPASASKKTSASVSVCQGAAVCGTNMTSYKYSTDKGASWSPAVTILANPTIQLTDLATIATGTTTKTVDLWVKGVLSDGVTETQTNASAVKVAWTLTP